MCKLPPISIMKMVSIDIPDHFVKDDSKRGKIVNLLMGGNDMAKRACLSAGKPSPIREAAFQDLERYYAKADQIICIMEEKDAD